MTQDMKRAPRPADLPAATLAALLLAGCSSGHIGESWQCPLAEGGSCDSVAAADPAVPDTAAAKETALAEPLWRVRTAGTETLPARRQAAETACEAGCGGGFDPLGWLRRLIENGEGENPTDGQPEPAPAAAKIEILPAGSDREADAAASPAAPDEAEPEFAVPVAALPAEAGPGKENPFADDLRTGEVVARIWIAPFVDANGVYREAGHVRVVLEPAGWRLK